MPIWERVLSKLRRGAQPSAARLSPGRYQSVATRSVCIFGSGASCLRKDSGLTSALHDELERSQSAARRGNDPRQRWNRARRLVPDRVLP